MADPTIIPATEKVGVSRVRLNENFEVLRARVAATEGAVVGLGSAVTSLASAVPSIDFSVLETADASLASAVSSLASAVPSIDLSGLVSADASLSYALSYEASRATSVENQLGQGINSLGNSVMSSLGAEYAVRGGADASLASAISNEAVARISADTSVAALVTPIAHPTLWQLDAGIIVQGATSAEASIAARLSMEESNRISADISIASAIEAGAGGGGGLPVVVKQAGAQADPSITSSLKARYTFIGSLLEIADRTGAIVGLSTSPASDTTFGSGLYTINSGTGTASLASGFFPSVNQPWTIASWLKTTATNGVLFAFGLDGYFTCVAPMVVGGGFQLERGSGNVPSGVTVNDGIWHHVAATYDGVYIRVYVDAVLRNTAAVAMNMGSSNKQIRFNQGVWNANAMNAPYSLVDTRIYSACATAEDVGLMRLAMLGVVDALTASDIGKHLVYTQGPLLLTIPQGLGDTGDQVRVSVAKIKNVDVVGAAGVDVNGTTAGTAAASAQSVLLVNIGTNQWAALP